MFDKFVMRTTTVIVIILIAILPASFAAPAAFETVTQQSDAVRSAGDARDIAAALRLSGKQASFRGNVAKVYVASSGKFVAVDFAKDYKKALVAVAVGDSVKRLPNLVALTGQAVLVSGIVTLHGDQPQIKVDSAAQVKLIVAATRSARKP